MRGEIEMNIRKLRTWKNSNFFFGWRGPLVMIFGGVGAGGVGREPDGRAVGARRARWQGRDGVPSQH